MHFLESGFGADVGFWLSLDSQQPPQQGYSAFAPQQVLATDDSENGQSHVAVQHHP